MLTSKEWKMFYRLHMILHYFPNPQPNQIGKDEAIEILAKQKAHGYSVGDLAFIFMRSKSTIHEFLKEKGGINIQVV
jgi:hypothetical protein